MTKKIISASSIDKHPSTLDDVIKSNTENTLDTSELVILNRVSIGLKYNRNMDKDIVGDLPMMNIPIHMELFHEYSQGRKREPHLRLVLYLPPLKENSKGKIEISYNKATRKLEGEGTPITLDVPNRYGEMVGQYHCHSIVESGEEAVQEFVDIICKRHIKEYGHPNIYKSSSSKERAFNKAVEKGSKVIALSPKKEEDSNG